MRILVVEDERELCQTIVRSLRRLAYSVDPCYDDGDAAIALLGSERYDLVLLDLNPGGRDGAPGRAPPATHRASQPKGALRPPARTVGRQGGGGRGERLSCKAFSSGRAGGPHPQPDLAAVHPAGCAASCGDLSFDTRSRTAAVNGQTLTLTRKETGILEYLMVHQGRPVSQEELMEHVWDNSVDSFSNSIRVHISALRKKLRAALVMTPCATASARGI